MPKFCLIKKYADEFKKRLKSGEINPVKMNQLSTEARQKFFETMMSPEAARQVNLEFERKIIQKDKVNAMIRWAENLTGVTTERRKIMIKTIKKNADERAKRIFSPAEDEQFLGLLAEQKLGIDISQEEAKVVFNLSRKIQEGDEVLNKKTMFDKLKSLKGKLSKEDEVVVNDLIDRVEGKLEGKKLTSDSIRRVKNYLGQDVPENIKKEISEQVDAIVNVRKNRGEYGEAVINLDDYIGKVKLSVEETFAETLKRSKLGFAGKVFEEVASTTKTAKATFDASFAGRQGRGILFRGLGDLAVGETKTIKIWMNMLKENFKTLYNVGIKGKDALRGIRAGIASRDNAFNGFYRKAKLAVGVVEEEFPGTVLEKIPGIGRGIKASDEAFTGSAYMVRADLFDLFLDKAQKNGIEITDEYLKGLGAMVNSMTGRGDKGLGRLPRQFNTIFFSPKFFQSQLDTLLLHPLGVGIPKEVRKEAQKNLASIVGSVGSIMMIANALKPGSAELDPRSSDFGKIKIGDTRFDVTGGASSLITLVARMIGGVKSSSTGIVTKSKGFTGIDAGELLANFTENKLSPLAGTFFDILKKENFNRDPLTIKAFKENPANVSWLIGKGLLIPIPMENFMENVQSDKVDGSLLLAATLLDFIGVGTNTYNYDGKWENKDTNEMNAITKEHGKAKVKEASKEYTKRVNEEILKLTNREDFKNESDEEKLKVITKIKTDKKSEVFTEFGFSDVETETTDNSDLYNKYIK